METNRIWGSFPAQKSLSTERLTQSNSLFFSSTRKTLTKQVPPKAAEMVRGLKQTTCQQLGWFRQRKRADISQNGLKSVLKGEFSASLLQLSHPQCYLPSSGMAVGLERLTETAALRNAVCCSHHWALWRSLIQQRLPGPFNPWHILSQSSKKYLDCRVLPSERILHN